MKAIYNITGEIVDIEDMSIVTYKSSEGNYVKTLIKNFTFIDAEKDYYTKLEHQYAGMAMQGMLSDNVAMEQIVYNQEGMIAKIVANFAVTCAAALVEKLKEKEK